MSWRRAMVSRIPVVLALVALAVFSACSGGSVIGPARVLADELPREYLDACEDARVALPGEISTNLVAITRANGDLKLVWDGTPGKSRVLVVTWTNKPYYDGSVGQDYLLPAGANVWVTAVPELKRFIRRNRSDLSVLRIEQLLGVPPNNGKTKFVELWVNPWDLFRPSPDPEVNDHEASLSFPSATSPFLLMSDTPKITDWDPVLGRNIQASYVNWFNRRRSTIYTAAVPYPWTRLGYTYDWGKTGDHVGLSEFVIRGGSTVGVRAVIPNQDYFDAALAEPLDAAGGSWREGGSNLSEDQFEEVLPEGLEN